MKISMILGYVDNVYSARPSFSHPYFEPMLLSLNEETETIAIAIASQAGFRCFTSIAEFKRYVRAEVLAEEVAA